MSKSALLDINPAAVTADRGQDSIDMKYFIGAILMLFTSSAMAGTSAGYGMGGQFSRFDPVVAEHNRSGVEPSAELLFHAGHNRQPNVTAKSTNHMLAAYKPRLRQYLMSNHYMDTLAFHTISGRDLIDKFGYRACPR
jgi:hypothetical protein